MNEVVDFLKTALWFLIAIIVGFVSWFGKRNAERIDSLEKCVVTRQELEKTLAQMREDRMEQHHENRSYLERIEHKIDENETRASKTRHDTKDEVHALAMQLAVISRQDRRNER